MSTAATDIDTDEELPPDRALRRPAIGFALVVGLVVAAAIVLLMVQAGAAAPGGLTQRSAEATVRQFIGQSVVQQNGYAACEYLTASEQAAIAALGGRGDECRDVLGGATSFFGISTASELRGLSLHTTLRGTRATVTATAPGVHPVTFVLVPVSAAERSDFSAPTAPWRIADGAGHVLAS